MWSKFASMLAVPTVWVTAVALTLASVPRIDCVCPNGRTKVFCLSSVFGRPGNCQITPQPNRSSPCGCCSHGNSQTTACEETTYSQSSSDSPSVHRRGCVKTFVSAELAPAEPTTDHAIEQATAPLSLVLVADSLELKVGLGCAESHFPSARPPSVDRVILHQQFRN